jgi:hypothetical protein
VSTGGSVAGSGSKFRVSGERNRVSGEGVRRLGFPSSARVNLGSPSRYCSCTFVLDFVVWMDLMARAFLVRQFLVILTLKVRNGFNARPKSEIEYNR